MAATRANRHGDESPVSGSAEGAVVAQEVSSSPLAVALTQVQVGRSTPTVNLLLLDFNPRAVFAGVKTALEAGVELGRLTGRRVRLMLLNPTGLEGGERSTFLAERLSWLAANHRDVSWSIACDDDLRVAEVGLEDVWLATHWMTAHAVDVASRAVSIDARRVLYLVQDYEPDFFASPEDRPAAMSTFAAGFTLVVNSRQVASYIESRGHGVVDPRCVFSPQFDAKPLMIAANRRTVSARPTVFFYGRPSKPRNMFDLGIATLRLTAAELAEDQRRVDIVMAGEAGPSVELGNGLRLRNLGLLDRGTYFKKIARTSVGLTLQASPHPSHLPFDLAISGATAVTNEVDGSRNAMHPRIIAAEGTPEALSAAVLAALKSSSRKSARTGYLPVKEGRLGVALHSALRAAMDSAGLLP